MNEIREKIEEKFKLSPQERDKKLQEIHEWQLNPDSFQKPDFSDCDLRGADLSGQNLYEVNFVGADLSNAKLKDADLTGVSFHKANLTGADLRGALLKGVNFSGASMERVVLEGVQARDVNFSQAVLVAGNLKNADISGSDFSNGDLKEINFQGAKLIKAVFAGANLTSGEIRNAELKGANFSRANLTSANLSQSNLAEAKFEEANLTQAVLQEANLSHARLFKSIFRETDLQRSNLKKAVLKEADLSAANLGLANLTGSNFRNARLDGARFAGVEAKRTDLRGASLIDSDLGSANFIHCKFGKADLSRTKLENPFPGQANFLKSDFTEANLTDAHLAKANLTDANFKNAVLIRANLTRAKTAGMSLGGAVVTNAELPEEIKSFDALKSIEDSSVIARKHFAWLLAGLGFSALTIASTNDTQLLTNSTTSPLPVIQTPFPIAWFYVIAPPGLLAIYLYFHLQLQHQWKLISKLPAVFPDGLPLNEKIFPWLINTWVHNFIFPRSGKRTFVGLLKNSFNTEKVISALRNLIVVAMGWYATPAVLVAFWIRYISRHDWVGTRLQIVLLVLAIIFSITFHILAKQTLKNKPLPLLRVILVVSLFVLPVLAATSSLSFKAIQGNLGKKILELRWFPWDIEILKSNVLLEIPERGNLNRGIDRLLTADFSEQAVSEKPDNFDPDDPEKVKWVRGASLDDANLNFVSASRAFLINSKLHGASLWGADLYQAQLSGAKMCDAYLRGADLRFADLSNADLSFSDLSDADLRETNLTGADLTGARLTNADLANADISNAVFYEVKDLTVDQVKSAIHWKEGFYEKPLQINLGIFFEN